MKKKWKWLFLLAIPLVLFAVLIWTMTGRDIPVDVYGDLPEKDVAELTAIVKQNLRGPRLPGLSWDSIKNFPRVYKYYHNFKLFSVVYDKAGESVQVLAWQYTNALKRADRSLGYPILDTNYSAYQHRNTIYFGATMQPVVVQSLGAEIIFTFHKTTNGWK